MLVTRGNINDSRLKYSYLRLMNYLIKTGEAYVIYKEIKLTPKKSISYEIYI